MTVTPSERVRTLLEREEARFEDAHPRFPRESTRPPSATPALRRPNELDDPLAGRFPVYVHTAKGSEVVDVDGITTTPTSASATQSAMCKELAIGVGRRDHRPARARRDDDAQRGRGRGRRAHGLAFRPAPLAVHGLGYRCEPLRCPSLPPGFGAAKDPCLQPLLPRERRRDRRQDRRRRRLRGSALREHRPADRSRGDDARRRVQRHLEALERELRNEDVACVLAGGALTNIGIVLPDDGYHAELRRLCTDGTLLVIDETHTLSCGPGGCSRRARARPDAMTMGKPIMRRDPDRRLRPQRRPRRARARRDHLGRGRRRRRRRHARR